MTFSETLKITLISSVTTFVINGVFHYLKNKLDWFEETKKFQRDHCYSQIKELYLCLYSIIVQSEYLRYFFEIEKDLEKLPFIELERKKYKTKINLVNNTIKSEEYSVNDAVVEFNKNTICETIIKNSKYASQDLLKLAVAYRYVHGYYTERTIDDDLLEKFQTEELKLINRIVITIVKETNSYLKLCKMNHNNNELETGIIDGEIYGA